MRVLVLYAHPVESSFGAALHALVVERLRARGHEVDDCDLYAEGFDPVLSRAERLGYHAVGPNRGPVSAYVERLLAAQALVLVSPIWNFGHPAILKGFLDRVFLPGVTFTLQDGRLIPGPLRLRKLAAVHTYGAKRWMAWLAGDPPRRVVHRILGGLLERRWSARYLALYDMNNAQAAHRDRFLARVSREMDRF
jgi:putative NADPH-quinone reductase